MTLNEKIEELIQEIREDFEGENFTDLSGMGLRNFDEVLEYVMDCDATNEYDAGFYNGAKYLGNQLNKFSKEIETIKESLSFALELLSSKELEIFNSWDSAKGKEKEDIRQNWEI